MTDRLDQGDLARLRALAEEGRRRPLLGGDEMIVYGIAIAVAASVHGLIALRILEWPGMAIAGTWFGVMLVASFLARLRAPRGTNGLETVSSRVERDVWKVSGLFFAVLSVSLFAWALLSGDPANYVMLALMPPIVFGVYAIAMAASAAAAQAAFLRPYAILAMAFVSLTAFLVGSPWQYGATALGALLVSVVPGLALKRRERTDG